MKRTALIFYLIAAALSVRADYGTLPVETDEAMGEFIRFESRSWAAEMSGEGGRLAASTTWTGEHVILNDVYVPSGVTLTLGPGAKVKFCSGTRIKVEDGGTIVLNGAEGEEVVLTGFADDTTFAGIVLQSNSASYSDNGYVVADGFAFGKFATVSLSDTTAFVAGGQAIIPVSVSGSRESAFSFDWVAETNGVAFASGLMSWSRVGDGTKNIVVPFDSASFAALSNFTVRASLLRCCNASKPTSIVTLSEFLASDIQTDEAMGDFIRFESRDWATNFTEVANAEGGRLTANTVWSNEHVIVSSVYIPSGVTLTLTADTVVRFCEGTMIKIEDGGKLEIVGADGHDVILRGYEGDTKYTGIVKMSSGTLTDNSYVRVDGFTLGTLANVALNNSSSFRSSGLALIPVTVSGSRDSSFSIDWVAETNGAPYKSGTMLWNRVSDGTKNISINYGAELDGLDKFTIRVAVHRACYANPDSCEVKISDFIVADIQTDEAMGDFIRFESRDWTTNFTEVANAEGGRLTGNTVWSNEHVIVSDVYIPSGVTLTLAADALVRFCEGTMIKIEDGGALNIVGVEGHDVILRNYDANTTSRGIVKMSSGTYTDNMYVQYPDFRYGSYPDITLHDAGVGRDAGKIFIPITLGGTSRNQAFNVDWETDKGASGTISWSQSSEGTKWIEIPVDAATFGGTETYGIRLTAARGANLAVANAKVTIYEFNHPVTETVSVTEGTETSNEFAVNGDIREQPIFLNEVEPVRYSGLWQTFDANEAVKLRVLIESDNGVRVLKEASVDETGEFAFRPEDYPVGHYTLKHEIVDKVGDPLATMSKTFSVVDREDVVMHGGTLTSNEIWKAGMTHVVYAPVSVPSIYTLFIEPGAVVKFLTGTGIDLQTGAALFANAIVFTHIDDDTVGGDTLSDGYTVAPPMDAYYLTGNFTFGDDAELRNITQKTALTGTLNGNKMLSKGSTYRVSGTFTIANGATLTIPAGTILKMENNAAIVVNSGGVLNANGTRAAPIVITSINDDSYSGATEGSNHNPQPGDWSKIGIDGGQANFDHTYVLYSSRNSTTGAINMNGGCVVFCNGVISHGMYDAVGVESGNFFMTNSVISDCLLAFRHWARDPIVNCIIYDCGRLTQGGSQNFVNCIFSRISETWEAFGFPQGTTYRNCCFWNEDGSVLTGEGTQDAMTVCGKDGNIWGDPLFVDPENGDFRIVAGSPCVDAADSSVAPELDFYGQPRITLTGQTNDVPVVQGQLADIGICEVMPRDVTSDIDLQPVSVRAEEKATPGQLIFVKWTVSNVGGVEVDGSWRDTISLVSENGQQVTLGDKITTSHIAVGGEVFCSAYFTVPAMAEGKWRLKVNVNSYHDIFEGSLFANNALTSDRTVEISLPSIDPAQGATDGVINAGVPKVLKLSFAEGEENRMVHLGVPVGVKVTYGFGFMPRGNSASGTVVADDTGVRFRVPEGATDVYVTLESDETATYELSYSDEKMLMASVTPNTLPSSGEVTLTITGAGFTSESQVEFIKDGSAIVPKSVRYVDAATLVVTIDCAKLAAGSTCDVRVMDGENAASAEGAVAVAAVKGEGKFWAKLIMPDSVRQGRVVTCYVEYGNDGNADMPAQVVQIIAEGDGTVSRDAIRFLHNIQFVAVAEDTPCGILKPGAKVRMPFSLKAGRNNSLTLSFSWSKTTCPPEWTSADSYLNLLSQAATCLAERGHDATDFDGVYRLANEIRDGSATTAFVGAVCDDKSRPVAGLLLELSNECHRVTGCTDDAGRFELIDVASGIYSLLAPAAGLLLDENVEITESVLDATPREYVLQKCNSTLNVRISATSIHPDIIVTCVPTGGESSEVITGVQIGETEFRIDGVRKGLYDIRATGMDCSGATLVYVEEDDVQTDVDLTVSDTLAISGRVENVSKGDAVAVYASCDSGIWRASPSAAGDFAFPGLVPGDYTFTVVGEEGVYYAEQHLTIDGADEFQVVFSRSQPPVKVLKTAPLVASIDYNSYYFFEVRQVARHLLSRAELLYDVKTIPYPAVACPENLNTYAYYCQCRREFALWIQYYKYVVGLYSQTKGADAAKECAYLVAEVLATVADLKGVGDKWRTIVSELELMTDVSLETEDGLNAAAIATVKYVINDIESATKHALETMESLDFQADSIGTMLDKIAMVGKDLSDIYSAFERVKGFEDMLAAASSKRKMNTRLAAMSREFNWQHTRAIGFVDKIRNLLSLYDRAKKASEKAISYFMEIEGLRNASNFFQGKYDWFNALKFTGYHDDCENPVPDPPYDPSENVTPNVPQSCDPNEMAGPLGTGDPETERFVKPGEWMTYTVYFENKADATAAAQEVTVTNPLSEWLDWSTFEMGEVAFNNQIDLGLLGKKNGTSEVKINGTSYSVRTELKLDEKTGVADWYMRIVDPNTETGWPEDVFAGFLPPNDETFRGEGHITYRVKVREDAPRGARIDNSATIVFDYNPPIETDPAWWNTVGADLETWPEDGDFSAKAANVYDAFLADESGNVVGIVQVKTAKQVVKKTTDKKTKKTTVTTTVTATATVTANGKKWSYTGGKVSAAGAVTGLKCTTKGCPVPKFGVTLGRNGLEGEWNGYAIFGARQVKPNTAYVKNWTVSFGNGDWVQLKVDSKGAVKFAGSAKGKAYSGSARLLTGDGFAFIPVVFGKNATLVRIESSGAVSVVSSSSGELAEGGVTAKPRFSGWNASANKMVGVVYKGSPVMNGRSWPLTFAASRLPTGCKINASTGVIGGIPTKAGTFLTRVVATSKSSKKWTAICVVTNRIVALPEWARGQFTGTVAGKALTMSVGSTGKISGKFKQGATNWTFSASSFTAASQTAAEPLTLVCSATAKGTYTVKSGKKTVTKAVTAPISFTLKADPAASSIAAAGDGDFAGGADNVEIRRVAGVKLSVNVAKGGTVKTDKSLGQAASGVKVKLTATLAKGYAFLGWYDVGTGERLSLATSYSLRSDGSTDRFVEARFAKETALTAADFTVDWGGPTNICVGVSYLATPKASGKAAVKIVAVTGLPAGLVYKSGKVSGAPTAAKTYTVSVKIALATNAKKYWVLKQKLVVEPLPAWARGAYVGGSGKVQATLAIGSTGKVSGRLNFANSSWTLTGTKYAKLDPEARTATLSLVAKKGTAKKTVVVSVGADELGGYAASTTSPFAFEARQNLWKADDAWAACAAELAGFEYADPAGDLTVLFGESGTATAKLKVGKNMFSCSTVFCPTGIDETAVTVRLYLYFAPNTKKGFKGAVRVIDVSFPEE